MACSKLCPSDLDPGIRDVVLLLRKAGFKTFTSCEGGKGHPFRHETIGLVLDSHYHSFHKRLVKFLRSQGMQFFQINLVTDYHPDHPDGKSYVYLEGLDLLAEEKRNRVVEEVKRKERRLRRQMRERGINTISRRKA
ncbi:MAG: hypothetical protein ABSG67_22415 [Thermoguttaceae bacterium]|jgi:hypothetical protein